MKKPEKFPALMLGAVGVVYGDVGTSPLYTLKEVFSGHHGIEPSNDNILGILSLIFWALIFVISIKYVLFVMRADNHGEGGIMALMALALRHRHKHHHRGLIITLGLFGTALFYGDGVITPAISVLSAVEGLEVAAPELEAYVLPVAVAVLLTLFLFQSKGSGKMGLFFGPIMCLWFATLAILGSLSILKNPSILDALNPIYGLNFCLAEGWYAFLALGAVVLALTGAEALYADMGHFGKGPIQVSWFTLVLPALMLNYFGQGALLLRDPGSAENPFYKLAPDWAMYPLIVLATIATVIASQAVISGVFSMTHQAMQLDYIPRMHLVHTSRLSAGQIFVPAMNRTLLIVVIGIVLGFQSSNNLAAAYGIAVTGTMSITTLLALVVAKDSWNWPSTTVIGVGVIFIAIDVAFFSSNLLKIPMGGWLPLALGVGVFILMSTWRRGREALFHRLQETAISLHEFIDAIQAVPPRRVPGTAVFMTARHFSMPPALQRNFAHNHILHERTLLLTVNTADIPRVPGNKRLEIEKLQQGFYRITAHYGFMERPDVMKTLSLCSSLDLDINSEDVSFFIGRETLIASIKPDLNPWQEFIFLFLFKNASSPIQYFKIPPERVVELGAQIEV